MSEASFQTNYNKREKREKEDGCEKEPVEKEAKSDCKTCSRTSTLQSIQKDLVCTRKGLEETLPNKPLLRCNTIK